MDERVSVCLYHSGIENKIDALCDKIDDRDKGYHEREIASKEAIKAAFNAAERAAEKTEAALKEYKMSANEWRETVQDSNAAVKELIAKMITRPDIERELKGLETQIADLREYRSRVEGRAVEKVETRTQSNWSTGLTVVVLLSLLSNILIVIHLLKG